VPNAYLATMGQRPAAITIALDVLLQRFVIDAVAILHTEPRHSGIADQLAGLIQVLKHDYAFERVLLHELQHRDGRAILDIDSESNANAYYDATVKLLRLYRDDGYTIHLMVAGGRKAMSIYATLAAGDVFGPLDRVWTVLSSPKLVQEGAWHAPVGQYQDVALVRLPVAKVRTGRNTPAQEATRAMAGEQRDALTTFFSRLSPEQHRIIDLLQSDPYCSNKRIGEILGKSDRTIDNQLRATYAHMAGLWDLATVDNKRMFLIDVIRGVG
jgi:CRISPR-associated protein Csx14